MESDPDPDQRRKNEGNIAIDVMLHLNILVKYRGKVTSKQSIARAICSDHLCELEIESSDGEIRGMAEVKLNSAEILPIPGAKLLRDENYYFQTGNVMRRRRKKKANDGSHPTD